MALAALPIFTQRRRTKVISNGVLLQSGHTMHCLIPRPEDT